MHARAHAPQAEMSLEAELGAAAAMKGMHLWEQTSLLERFMHLVCMYVCMYVCVCVCVCVCV